MKKYLILVSSAIALSLQACVKYEKPAGMTFRTVGLTDRIEITDVAGTHPAISEVAFVARYHMPPGVRPHATTGPAGEDTRILLRMPFGENGTRLLLPENPPQALLNSIGEDFPAGFEISDRSANTVSFTEIACNMADNRVSATLSMGRTINGTAYKLEFIYCDRPVTITGSGQDWWDCPTTYDLKLEKGWNMVVEKSEWSVNSDTKTVTNQMPDGMEWQYGRWLGGR